MTALCPDCSSMSSLLIVIWSIFNLCWPAGAFAQLVHRQATSAPVAASAPSASATISSDLLVVHLVSSPLVDVTGDHAYTDPLPGQAQGPCPAQNALANHGYLDRSGFIIYLDCIRVNRLVFNLGEDLGAMLCLRGQFNGGGLLDLQFSIGNSSAVDATIRSSCGGSGLLEGFLDFLKCSLAPFLNRILGAPGFGMAQTHNSFEGDASFFKAD